MGHKGRCSSQLVSATASGSPSPWGSARPWEGQPPAHFQDLCKLLRCPHPFPHHTGYRGINKAWAIFILVGDLGTHPTAEHHRYSNQQR